MWRKIYLSRADREHYYKHLLTQYTIPKSDAAYIIEACNNYEALKETLLKAKDVLEYALTYVEGRALSVEGDIEEVVEEIKALLGGE
jgi:hypothetical protein